MRSRRSGDNRVQIDAGRSLIAGSKPTRQGGQRFKPDSRRFVGVRQFMSGVVNGISRRLFNKLKDDLKLRPIYYTTSWSSASRRTSSSPSSPIVCTSRCAPGSG